MPRFFPPSHLPHVLYFLLPSLPMVLPPLLSSLVSSVPPLLPHPLPSLPPSRSVPVRNVPIRPVPFRTVPYHLAPFYLPCHSALYQPVPYHIVYLTVRFLYRTVLFRTVPQQFPSLLPTSHTKTYSQRPSNPTSRVDFSRHARAPVRLSTCPNPQPSCHSLTSSHPHC